MNAGVSRGHTVLITGIGGGVALLALQLCVALGASVYVTSGSDAKLTRAVALGAAGGVNYRHSWSRFPASIRQRSALDQPVKTFPEDWPKALKRILGGTLLDSVIDSAGGPISQQIGGVLRPGGRIVLYGMTAAQQVPFTMREVLRNQQLIGESSA